MDGFMERLLRLSVDPNTRVLYHATTETNLNSILSNDYYFLPGERGCLGSGIYFSDNPEKAIRRCKYNEKEDDIVVVRCQLRLGAVKHAQHTVDDPRSLSGPYSDVNLLQEGYDSASFQDDIMAPTDLYGQIEIVDYKLREGYFDCELGGYKLEEKMEKWVNRFNDQLVDTLAHLREQAQLAANRNDDPRKWTTEQASQVLQVFMRRADAAAYWVDFDRTCLAKYESRLISSIEDLKGVADNKVKNLLGDPTATLNSIFLFWGAYPESIRQDQGLKNEIQEIRRGLHRCIEKERELMDRSRKGVEESIQKRQEYIDQQTPWKMDSSS